MLLKYGAEALTYKHPKSPAQITRDPKMHVGRAAAVLAARAAKRAGLSGGMIPCSGCHQGKLASEFPTSRLDRFGEPRYKYCKTCHTIKQRVLRLRWFYGMSPEDYELMHAHQGGVCAICLKPPARLRLAIDHDHKTGQIRGLLCAWCNRALGQFRDDLDRVKRVLEYFVNPPCTAALGAPRYGSKGRVSNKAETRRRLNREAKP